MGNDIHQRLKYARIRAGYHSATSFAGEHGLTESTYAAHENGGRGITLAMAKKYSDLLGIYETWLLTGEGEMAPPGFGEHKILPFVYSGKQRIPSRDRASERELHKTALAIAREVLQNRRDQVSFEEANDLAWRMVDLAAQLQCDAKKVNAEMAEWLLTWEP